MLTVQLDTDQPVIRGDVPELETMYGVLGVMLRHDTYGGLVPRSADPADGYISIERADRPDG